MSLSIAEVKKNTGKKDFGRVEDGTYPARIVSVVDLGSQMQTDYKTGDETGYKEKVMITWEFPTERIEITKDGETRSMPRWQGKEFTLSFNEKAALTKLVGNIAPDIAVLSELINIPCAVSIASTSGGNAKVDTVSKPMKGFETPDLENDTVFFDFSNPEENLFNSIPLWMRKKITHAENYSGFADDWDLGEDESKGDF